MVLETKLFLMHYILVFFSKIKIVSIEHVFMFLKFLLISSHPSHQVTQVCRLPVLQHPVPPNQLVLVDNVGQVGAVGFLERIHILLQREENSAPFYL